MLLTTLHWPDEIRSTKDLDLPEDDFDFKPAELQMAEQLVEAMTDEFDPGKYKDEYREALLQVIQAKVDGVEIAEPEPVEESANLVDLMKLLQASVQAGDRRQGQGRHGADLRRGRQEGARVAVRHEGQAGGQGREQGEGRRGRGRGGAAGAPPQERLAGVRRRPTARARPSRRRRGGPRRPPRGSPVALERGPCRLERRRPELERCAGRELGEAVEVGRDDHADDGIAAGRLMVGEEDDRQAVGRELDRALHDTQRRELRRRLAGDGRALDPDAHPVARLAHGPRPGEERLEHAAPEGGRVRPGQDPDRGTRRRRLGRASAPPDGRAPRPSPGCGSGRPRAAPGPRARRTRRRSRSTASRGRRGRRCRPGPRGSRERPSPDHRGGACRRAGA